MAINEHIVLIVDSSSLQYNIIVGAGFLDKCGFHLNYDQNIVCWIEYDVPFCNTSDISPTVTHPLCLHQLIKPLFNFLQHKSFILNTNRPTSMMFPLTNNVLYWISNVIC